MILLNKYNFIIISLFCFTVSNANCQDVTQEIEIVNDFNKSVSSMKFALNRMSNNFYFYNNENKDSADILLNKVLTLSESLRNPKNEFLFKVYDQLDSLQRIYVKDAISLQMTESDPLYNELVSLYNLTSHYDRILSKVDSSSLENTKTEFISKGYFSDYNRMQLKYISTLANLDKDTFYENKLLLLVKQLYSFSKNIDDENNRNRHLVKLYNQIAPSSIGKIYSKSSVVNSLYLIDDSTIVSYSSDVMDSRLAWDYIVNCVLYKMAYFDEKYWDVYKFYDSIDSIKEELLTDKSIWKSHIRM